MTEDGGPRGSGVAWENAKRLSARLAHLVAALHAQVSRGPCPVNDPLPLARAERHCFMVGNETHPCGQAAASLEHKPVESFQARH